VNLSARSAIAGVDNVSSVGGGLIRYTAALEQLPGVFAIDREIDVLGDGSGPFHDAQTIEVGDDNTSHGAAHVEKRLPLFPGYTGAVICGRCGSSRGPASLLTIPAVTLAWELSRPWSGKPTTTTGSPGLTRVVAAHQRCVGDRQG